MDPGLNATRGLTWLLWVDSLNGIRGRTKEIRLFAPTSAPTWSVQPRCCAVRWRLISKDCRDRSAGKPQLLHVNRTQEKRRGAYNIHVSGVTCLDSAFLASNSEHYTTAKQIKQRPGMGMHPIPVLFAPSHIRGRKTVRCRDSGSKAPKRRQAARPLPGDPDKHLRASNFDQTPRGTQ